ncbi:MAG: serine--tRNA ligase [Pseudomonadota bacterium]
MFDLRAIVETPDVFRSAWETKQSGLGSSVDQIIALAEALRAATTKKQAAETDRNAMSKKIGQAKAAGDDAEFERLRQAVADAKLIIEAAGEDEAKAQAELDDVLLGLPNLPMPDVPAGANEEQNVEQRRWGEPNSRLQGRNALQDHADLGATLGMMDFETAAKMSGARFVLLTGKLARLERALAAYMLDVQTEQNDYTECSPPFMVRANALKGTGQLPKFEEDLFKTSSGHYTIPTSEVPLTNIVAETIIEQNYLPRRYTAHTPCFRSEAGSAGRDTKGMIRLHQFNKVEMVSIVAGEEEGLAELERMTKCAEGILEALDLPYRRMLLCAGDMGFGARKTYDLEVWLPSQSTYREISSCSYCGDFQARRMNARWRPAPSETTPKPRLEFVHTLNGSGLAVGRTLVAVMENYQNEDGSIGVPGVLQSYMGGLEVIA